MKSQPARYAARFLGSWCALAAAGCSNDHKDHTPELVKVRYAQTYCADRWRGAPDTQQLVLVAQTYLAQQGLTLQQPQASIQNAGKSCRACTCTTGLVLEGKVSAADLSAIVALGFTKQ